MKRRDVLRLGASGTFGLLLGGCGAQWPIGVRKMPRLAVLFAQPHNPITDKTNDALIAGLQDYGYIDGQSIQIDRHYLDSTNQTQADMAALIADLAAAGWPDVIVASGTSASQAAQEATQQSGIPVVSVFAADPVDNRIVQSLAHPGGNLTGISRFLPALAGKRLELLQELVPRLTRVGFLYTLRIAGNITEWDQLQKAATAGGLTPIPLVVSTLDDLQPAVETAVQDGVDAIMASIFVVSSGGVPEAYTTLAQACVGHRLPSMGDDRQFAEYNGLLGYGANEPAAVRRSAYYISRILAGAKPSDLPVEQPTNFDLVGNRTTAEALGIAIPSDLAAQVTEWVP
jgi:putative ABC transport system substrate-binding protein